MSRSPTPAPSPSRRHTAALALHRVGGAYRYVIVNAAGGGGNGNAAVPRVTDSGSIPVGDAKALEALRAKAGSGAAFVQVIPPDATILRSAPPKLVLDGTPEQVAGALSLVAEAELPSTVPAHRRAAGVLRAGHAHAVYAVGWIGPEGVLAPEAVAVPAVAAVAALHRVTGAPDGIAAWADQGSGVVAIVGAGKGESPRLYVRVLRDDPSDNQAFSAVREEALDDAIADLDADAPTPVGAALWLPRRPPANTGITGDEKLSESALAYGAAAAAIDARPDEQPLFSMTDRSPTAGRSIFTRIADGLSTPRAAVLAAAACVVLLLGGWILAAPIKLSILQSRVGDDSTDFTKAVQQHDWYKALRDRRWPMTALMAELTSSAPEGVRIETLAMDHGRPVSITGTANDAASVEAWCRTLRGKVFTDVTPNMPAEDVSPIRFTITARVADAMLAAVSELKPVAVSDAPRPARADTPGGSRSDRTPRPGSSGTSGRTNGRTNETTRPSGDRANVGTRTPAPAAPAGAVVEPPPPMSDSQIDRLNSGSAMLEWAKRKGQITRTDLDAATRTRLEHELARIEARRKALQGGGQ
ncbi:MAG TPA: PilN domain-containing protein [Phycisphaerales bacterium]|nr:PilN domain-containing protein [Phycisphaerales bacterium]